MLQQVGADRVISQRRGGAKAAIDEKETGDQITIRVQGFIDRDRLVLPGGKFRLRQTAEIRDLLQKFRDDGGEVTLSEKKAFGLTAKQLVWVHAKLAQPVEFSTRGKPAAEVVRQLSEQSGLEVVKDEAVRRALASGETIRDELQGLSTGTALAAALRPLGLVVEPHRVQGNDIQLHLRAFEESDEHWPVGWPSQQVPIKTEPRLFEEMPIQISNFPMGQVIDAVQQKAGVPFLLDHNSIARDGVDLAATKVTVVESQITLTRLLSKVLRQSRPRMAHELRVDERGKAFLWISPR